MMGATLLPEVVGLTITLAVPETLVFWAEVAVTVTVVIAVTVGAVRTPEVVIDPALVLQVTVLLKLPVPLTVAEH